MILRDSLRIRASPEAIFRFFEEVESNYARWHPDHVLFRWVSGRGLEEGQVAYFEEHLAGKLLKQRVVYTRVVPDQYIEFAPTSWLLRIVLPRMLFRIEPENDHCRFTAEIHVRIGPIGARLNRKELDAVRQHMREEGENLKHILEDGIRPVGGPVGVLTDEPTIARRITMVAQDNKAISRRFFEEVWNEGKLDVITDIVTGDGVLRDRDMGEHRGYDATRDFVSTYRKAFPDLRFTIEEQIAEGDKVVTRWRAKGTHRGELMGIPPTEKSVSVSGVTIDRIADGKIAESIGSWDALGMMQQLGVLSGQAGGQS